METTKCEGVLSLLGGFDYDHDYDYDNDNDNDHCSAFDSDIAMITTRQSEAGPR
jgi:hypothetical protein